MEIKKGQVWECLFDYKAWKKGKQYISIKDNFLQDDLSDNVQVTNSSFIREYFKLVEEEQGLRYNDGKPKWSLIDFDTLEGALKVFEFGKEKYGVDNWKKGLLTTEICESLMRHLVSYLNSNDLDKETNLPHVDHILCNAIMLAYTQRFNNKFDDRRLDKNKKCCGNWNEEGKCKCL